MDSYSISRKGSSSWILEVNMVQLSDNNIIKMVDQGQINDWAGVGMGGRCMSLE